MKRVLLFTLVLLPFITSCGPSNKDGDTKINTGGDIEAGENIQTRNYKNVKADKMHPEVEDGYIRISNVLINLESFIDDAEEEITYLYKLSCNSSSVSFKAHKIPCDEDGFYYAEISEDQHKMIPNGFSILKNSNKSGSAAEISIEGIHQCFTYRELYYSESKQKIKVVDFNHVIPGLDESAVDSLIGKSVDYHVYVDETGIKTLNYGNLPFTSELIIKYIDVSGSEIQIKEYK